MDDVGGGGGGSYLRSIADAAIEADMEHREFHSIDGGEFVKNLGSGASYDNKIVVVSDGNAYIQGHADEAVPSEVLALQSEVFDYWPEAIDSAFEDWLDLPQESDFCFYAEGMSRGAAEIQLGVKVDGEEDEYKAGNVRLSQDLSNLDTRTGQLAGHYAETFHEGYVAPLPDVIDHNHALADVLAISVGGEAEIWKRANEDARTLQFDAVTAMKSSGPSGGDGTDLKLALTIIGSVATAVSIFATAGTTTALAASLTAAGAGTAGSLLGDLSGDKPDDDVPLGAGHPDDVLANIKEALREVDSRITEEETHVRKLLSSCLEATNAGKTDGNFDLKPKGLKSSPSSWLDGEQLVIVDAETIAKITEWWIPTINGDLRACRRELVVEGDGWVRPASIGIGAKGPWSEFADLQDRLNELLHGLAEELNDAGEKLQEAARIIGVSDEETNERFAKKAKKINSDNVNEPVV
jgi:hypothetical protein